MISVNASIDPKVLQNFQKACARYQTEVGRSQKQAVRTGVIQLLKSLRARDGGTRQAPKKVPADAVKKYGYSKYKTYTNSKGKTRRMPLWGATRRGGDEKYIKFGPARTKGEARTKLGTIARYGLARRTWGALMRVLFNRAEGTGYNPKARVTSGMISVEKHLRETGSGRNQRVELEFTNRIKYIREALYPGALERAFKKATNSISAQINKGLVKARKEIN